MRSGRPGSIVSDRRADLRRPWLRLRVTPILVVMLAASLSVTVVVEPRAADAYALNPAGCKWSGTSPAIGYRFVSASDTYKSATRTADSKWDATASPGYFYETTSTSDDDVIVDDADYGANGWIAWISGNCGGDDIWIDPLGFHYNTEYEASSMYTSTRRYVVGVHELGHVYGLAHYDGNNCDGNDEGLMHSNPLGRYTSCGWTSPTANDVAGVNAVY